VEGEIENERTSGPSQGARLLMIDVVVEEHDGGSGVGKEKHWENTVQNMRKAQS
jgi:hypothetical protein